MADEAGEKLILVGAVADIGPGQRKIVEVGVFEHVVVLNVDGQFFALSTICPHAGGQMEYGPIEGYVIECPLHYWPFDVRTGYVTGMSAGYADEHLDTYPVVIQDEQVFIKLKVTSDK